MVRNIILVKNLNAKVSETILNGVFMTLKPILKIDLYKDESGVKCAKIEFESEQKALEAVQLMDGKEIMKSKVQIELLPDQLESQQPPSTSQKISKLDRQSVGDKVYPLALAKYQNLAPKLTGMVVDSIFNIPESELILELLSNETILNELIDQAFLRLKIST